MTSRVLQNNVEDLLSLGCRIVNCDTELMNTIANILVKAADFFRNDDLKMAYRTDIGEGYRPFAFEYTDSPDQPDLVECFSCSCSRSSIKSSFPEGRGLALYEVLLAAHEAFADLAENLTREVFNALMSSNLPPTFRFGFLEWSRLQVNYGVTQRAQRELLHVLHEDGNLLTIAYSTAPGLELVASDGEIQDLWCSRKDRLITIAGKIFSSVTKGRVPPGYHQVRRRLDVHERFALLYFADPDPRAFQGLDCPLSPHEVYECITQGWLRSGVAPVQVRLDSDEMKRGGTQ